VINAGIYDTAAAKRPNGTMRPMERHALRAHFESGSATSEASSAVHDAAIIEPDRHREPPHYVMRAPDDRPQRKQFGSSPAEGEV